MVIRQCGYRPSPDLGGDGGKAGAGGFAQTITTLNEFNLEPFGTPTIYYYLGKAGEHDDSGDTGGASTIVTTVEPQSGNPIALSDIVLIVGGGGGGEGGNFDTDGSDGGGGEFAYSTAVGESDTDMGSDASSKGNGGFPGAGGGGTSCSEGIACKGEGGDEDASGTGSEDGHQGFGGESGGSNDDPGPRKWINGTLELEDDAGKGGEGFNTDSCDSGGGGGGGSYAAGSKKTDSDATSTNPKHSGDGEVIIIFNTDPSN